MSCKKSVPTVEMFKKYKYVCLYSQFFLNFTVTYKTYNRTPNLYGSLTYSRMFRVISQKVYFFRKCMHLGSLIAKIKLFRQ